MVKEYVYIDVVDTALLCGLDIKQGTLGNTEVEARCPYCQDYKYRMYLSRNPESATFWCHNCATGGNAVILFADWNPMRQRLSTKEAFQILLNEPRVHSGRSPYEDRAPVQMRIRPVHERSQIYLSMLEMLTISDRHYQNLIDRGLSDEIIRGNMYKSVPLDWRVKQRVVDALASRYDLSDMPGFHTKDYSWRAVGNKSGILIPVCDKDNQIQGLQIRLDDPPPKIVTLQDGTKIEKKGERFRWFSTAGDYYENGTGISSYIHVVGDLSSDTLHITEGPMKADIASFLSGGGLFIGLTGVQNIRYLADVVSEIHPQKIIECIDMDVRTNPNVQKCQAKIQSVCMPLCEEYTQFSWPVNQKGIDDWLLFQKLKQEYSLSMAA